MNASPLQEDPILPAVVSRLRAAGCVFAEEEAGILLTEARTSSELAVMLERRAAGQPLEHVVGWAEFCGKRIRVDAGIFIPRPRTEFLVRQAAARARPGAIVVDLCCGSGALGAALYASLAPDGIRLYAVDIDPAAVSCARSNVTAVGGHVYEGDLYEPLSADLRGSIDILIANVPYVPTSSIGRLPSEARLYEARLALDGGSDGLDVMRRVVREALHWLAPGGSLFVEVSEGQATSAYEVFVRNGLIPQVARSDEWEATVLIGTRPV